jgi:hypothetical protein
MSSGEGRWYHCWLLLGCRQRWLDALLTGAVVAVLIWSRFSLLASGPWEWDETLFAHGLVKFSLAAHFPHPPGFPGWLAIGHLLLPMATSPLHALQLASALLSVLCLWPLALIGRRVAPPYVATLAAMLVLFLPGPWLHAVRGFSSTAAATLALAAVAVAVNDREQHRVTLFTLLVAGAFLIRPILLPGLAVLWLGVVTQVRPWRRILPGALISIAGGLVATAIMVWAEGGWQRFTEAFVSHGSRHLSRLSGNPGGWPELGLVKGLGGEIWAAVLLLAALLGLVVWARRVSRRSALLWGLVMAVCCVQLLWLQNRTYTRYAAPVQLALAPLLAGAATLAPVVVAGGGLLLLTGVVGWRAYPLLDEQHSTQLPGWHAVTTAATAAEGKQMTVVVESGLHPYASYHWHWAGGGELKGDPRLVLSPWAPEPWQGIDRPYLVATDHPEWYLAPLTGGVQVYDGVSQQLQPFTQQRFLTAAVISNPPLPVQGWWPSEVTSDGERFMWGTAGAGLVLPPLPAGTSIELDLRPALGPAPLQLTVNGAAHTELAGEAGRIRFWIEPDRLVLDTPVELGFERGDVYPPGATDTRPLSVQLFSVRVVGPALPWQGSIASVQDRERLRVAVDGAYPQEQLGDHGRACWLHPHARLAIPAGKGKLTLTMWAPRPLPAETVIRVSGRQVLGPLSLQNRPTEVEVPILDEDVANHQVRIEIESVPYNPAAAGRGRDPRDLGVVLQAARFQPPPTSCRQWIWPAREHQRESGIE